MQMESSFCTNSVSLPAARMALKSRYSLYCGNDEAMSCPSLLSILPLTGGVSRLSIFTRSATCIQKSRFAVIVYTIFVITIAAKKLSNMAMKLYRGIIFLLSNLLISVLY